MNALLFNVKVVGFSLFLGLSAVVAGEIDPALLAKERSECVKECRLGGNNGFVCETLCGCTVDHFSKLTSEAFLAMKTELESEKISPETQSYLADVGSQCVAELDRIMKNLEQPPATD